MHDDPHNTGPILSLLMPLCRQISKDIPPPPPFRPSLVLASRSPGKPKIRQTKTRSVMSSSMGPGFQLQRLTVCLCAALH